MKQTTKLVLMFAGAGVASAFLLSGKVAEATVDSPMLAMGTEGLVALGGGYFAWKKKSKAAAVVSGVAAGLLASAAKGALLAPSSEPQQTPALVAQASAPKPLLPRQQPSVPSNVSNFVLTPERPELLR